MAASCDHEEFLVKSTEWTMSEPISWWETEKNVKHTALHSFTFAPNVQFFITAHTFGDDWGLFEFRISDPQAYNHFEAFLWIEQNGTALSDRNGVPLAVNEGIEVVHGYNPIDICCQVRYKKKCPYCIIEEKQDAKFIFEEVLVRQIYHLDGESMWAIILANTTDEDDGQLTSSSNNTSTSSNNLPESFSSCEQEPMDVNENERPQLSEEAMNQQEMFTKFQEDFNFLSDGDRAAIMHQIQEPKEMSNLD
ncbi:hypothetical protein M3Y94_00010000 [Aphelenchoides besseyi]|nr:hypothetical protein M3Y94_00010000 [Aphelenchoides besseyi]